MSDEQHSAWLALESGFSLGRRQYLEQIYEDLYLQCYIVLYEIETLLQ